MRRSKGDAVFVVFTPYQVVGAVNFVQGAQDGKEYDIYVHDFFTGAQAVAEALKKTGLFCSVVFISRYNEYTGIVQKLITLIRILAPIATLRRHTDKGFVPKKYDVIFMTGYIPMVDSVKLANPHADIYEYEDGMASYYYDDMQSVVRTGLFQVINKWLLGGRLTFRSKRIYLNHPQLYKGGETTPAYPIPRPKNNDALKTVFSYQPNPLYETYQTVYLTQPLQETPIGAHALTVEKDILAILGKDIALRIHPRQSVEDFAGYTCDTYNNLWELECAEQITDNHILIGACSTAQFTPKMLCDKEPIVIFTFPMYGEYFSAFTRMVDMLRSMYTHPERVILVRSAKELQAAMQELLK